MPGSLKNRALKRLQFFLDYTVGIGYLKKFASPHSSHKGGSVKLWFRGDLTTHMKPLRHFVFNKYLIFFFLLFFIFFPVNNGAAAPHLAGGQFRTTIKDTLNALWTGRAFDPELVQRQRTVKNALDKGLLSGDDLKRLITEATPDLVNRFETSRYILEEIPDRFNVLFSPYLDWNTAKEKIIWGTIASLLGNKDPFILKLATLAPEGTPWLDVPQTILVPRIIKLTKGALKPKFYTGGVMGEDSDVLRKMDIGQMDGCGCTTLGVVTASPDASIFMVPNLFNNYEEIDFICRTFRKRLDQSFEKRGYICGAIIDTGFLYVFSKNKMSGLEDLRKQKALTSLGRIESALLDELNVDAIPVAVPEVVSALSTGLADTFIAPPAWALGMQAYQYVNYYIQKPFYYSPGVVLLSTNTRQKIRDHFDLSEPLVFNTQELIVLEIKSIEPEWKKRGRIYEAKSLNAFESRCGIKPVRLSAKDQACFEKAAENVREKLAGSAYSADLLDDVVKALKQYRKMAGENR